jgi:hypothetical protein
MHDQKQQKWAQAGSWLSKLSNQRKDSASKFVVKSEISEWVSRLIALNRDETLIVVINAKLIFVGLRICN